MRATSRRIGATLAAAALAMLGAVPASASTGSIATGEELIAESSAVAFALRPTYDPGGAAPLHFYVGYAESNASTPSPESDGQASWYNFNIVETAAFRPPEECTPSRNAGATTGGTLPDAQAFVTEYVQRAAGAIAGGEAPPKPEVPSLRHACSERFPGFAQSRSPATGTIDESARDDYFDKPTAAGACRENPASEQCKAYKSYWPSFETATGAFVRDGSFVAESTPGPGQRSEALLFGAGDGTIVSVGLSRTETSTTVEKDAVVVTASTTLDDVCLNRTTAGCALKIDRVRQFARVRKPVHGDPTSSARTVVLGVHSTGLDREITAKDLSLDQASYAAGDYFQVSAISKTHSCEPAEDDPKVVVADAGGIRIAGKGSQGGAIMIGGACARARVELVSFEEVPFPGDPGSPGVPSSTLTVPGVTPAPGGAPAAGGVRYGPPRVVTRSVTHVEFRSPVAWRTAPWWGSIAGALAVAGALGFVFRSARAVRPVAAALDRFARQYVRG